MGITAETMKARRKVTKHLPCARGKKKCQHKILYQINLSFRNEGKIKTFSEKGKLKECVGSAPTLKQQK